MPDVELFDAIKIEVQNSQNFASIQDPVFDFQKTGRISEKNGGKLSVMVAVVDKSSIDSLLSYFIPLEKNRLYNLKKILQAQDFVGLNLVKIIPVSIALGNVIKNSKKKLQETMVVLEMGSISSELNIYRDGQLEFTRRINVTGLDFTRALTSALSTHKGKVELTIKEAEWVKKEFGIPTASEEYLIKDKITADQAISLLRPKLEQLIKEITRSFDFFYDKKYGSRVDRMVLFGGGTMLKRLPEYLNAELGLPVEPDNFSQNIEFLYEGMLDDLEHKQRLTLALGAALSDVNGINLLPEPLRDSKKKFVQKIVLGLVGITSVLVSAIICILLLVRLHGAQQESARLINEYNSMSSSINAIKDELKLQKFVNHRLDMGEVLKRSSHLSGKAYLYSLNIDNGGLSLSGVMLANPRETKRRLKSFLVGLERIALQNVVISKIEADPKDNQRTDFTITAKWLNW